MSEASLAQAIQAAVQPKLVENGWVVEDGDTELSEYITLMVTGGKSQQQVVSEVGTDLLGVGEDDPAVAELAAWLFQQLPVLQAQVNGGGQQSADQAMDAPGAQTQDAQNGAPQPIPSAQDSQMDDAGVTSEAYVYPRTRGRARRAYTADPLAQYSISKYNYPHQLTHNRPSGPKAMRNGSVAGRGRDKRMLGQLNRQLDRSQDDPLRRIKGAAGGQTGRINAHAGREPPRGPRGGGVANGMQRMMNGRPAQNMMPQQPGGLNPQQQMQFLQMMEMQSQMMAQMFNGQPPNMRNPQQQQRGGGKSLFDRVDKRQNGAAKNNRQHIHNGGMGNGDGTMEMDTTAEDGTTARKAPFDTLCYFNDKCTNATCPYAHQSPAAPPGTAVDLSDRCSFGPACQNKKCAGKHPSPAQRRQHASEAECKFYPDCTNPNCPFSHPNVPRCRNGADCATPGCTFAHSKINCRYPTCTMPNCPYKHTEGQKRKFEDKVWTANGGEGFDREAAMREEGTGKSDRFQGLKQGEAAEEELILPGRATPERGADDGIVS